MLVVPNMLVMFYDHGLNNPKVMCVNSLFLLPKLDLRGVQFLVTKGLWKSFVTCLVT